MKQTRFDMFVEIATDMVNDASKMDYDDLHAWLQPIFIKMLKEDFEWEEDETVAGLYEERLGVSPAGWEQED
jgi:hypothetical protein